MKSICLQCSVEFTTYPNWIKRGGGKFCSKICQGLSERVRSERECHYCGEIFTVTPSQIKYNKSKYCSHKCSDTSQIGKKRPNCAGEKHPGWLGGISRMPYPFNFNDELKESIRKRDNYICQLCGLTDEEHVLIYGYSLVIHHIDYVKDNTTESNLIASCIQCNSKVNFNREHWTDYFNTLINHRRKK